MQIVWHCHVTCVNLVHWVTLSCCKFTCPDLREKFIILNYLSGLLWQNNYNIQEEMWIMLAMAWCFLYYLSSLEGRRNASRISLGVRRKRNASLPPGDVTEARTVLRVRTSLVVRWVSLVIILCRYFNTLIPYALKVL